MVAVVVRLVRLWLALSQLDTNIMIRNNQYPLSPAQNIIMTVGAPESQQVSPTTISQQADWKVTSSLKAILIQGQQALHWLICFPIVSIVQTVMVRRK